MKLKNIGAKIVNVGSVVLMPGDEKEFPEKTGSLPAIRALCEKNFLEIVGNKEENTAPAQPAAEAEPAKEPAEGRDKEEEPKKETAKATGSGRKKKSE